MTYFPTFKGEKRPVPYALIATALFFSQHALAFIILHDQGRRVPLDWTFLLMPMRTLSQLYPASNVVLIVMLGYLLLVAWMLAAVSFQRAANADISAWTAALAIVPMLQLPVIVGLSVVPPRRNTAAPHQSLFDDAGPEWAAAAQGVLAGVGLTLLAVAMGALLFGTYGYGMFVVSPFVIGALTAYLANRKQDIGGRDTAKFVTGALLLGGLGLVVGALEGIVCIIMAAPLALGIALIGGLLGRAIALYTKHSVRQTLSGVALLPLVFAGELLLPPAAEFEAHMTIEIAAPPSAVWTALVDMQEIQTPVALPFRLGIAYPMRGVVIGEGVGALRHGTFTTGTAVERVTEWEPGRLLAFAVVSDVPAMRELSPYPHVHAPHVSGYFRTTTTRFELQPHSNGTTKLLERTAHELRLDPVFYWLPLTRWVVRLNNERIMHHIKKLAEAR